MDFLKNFDDFVFLVMFDNLEFGKFEGLIIFLLWEKYI